jgi:hypothetical protein
MDRVSKHVSKHANPDDLIDQAAQAGTEEGKEDDDFQNVSLNPIWAVRFCPDTAVRYVALLSAVSMV